MRACLSAWSVCAIACPTRSPSPARSTASLAPLVAGSVFLLFTGTINIADAFPFVRGYGVKPYNPTVLPRTRDGSAGRARRGVGGYRRPGRLAVAAVPVGTTGPFAVTPPERRRTVRRW